MVFEKVIIMKPIRRAISKNYFVWVGWEGLEDKVFDQRVIDKLSNKEENIRPALDHRKIETKIAVYEDRVKEWFLEIGERLKQENEAGFVICAVFEPVKSSEADRL